ncbi:ricin-type beta-trefoil lectin domain protein [Kitasatospora sp. NPDC097605]|uniref:ricin-type beta-trefoil lectin domain protein n=1 Tax=Kitasatospora sp. NPDC097605 TaxID=3157226 RepID=UPI003316777C
MTSTPPRPAGARRNHSIRRTAARGSVIALAAGLLAGAPLAHAADPAPVETPTGTRVTPVAPGFLYPGSQTDGCGVTDYSLWGWLPGGTSSLTATLNGSSASLGAEFHVRDTAAPNTDVLTGRVDGLAPGARAEFALDRTKLVEGHAYTWNVVGTDADGNRSAATTDCRFRVDHRAPRFTRLSLDDVPHAAGPNRLTSVVTDYDPKERLYTSGHACLEYRIDEAGPWTSANCGALGGLTMSTEIAFPRTGPTTLHVRDVDQAGNYSAEAAVPTFVYPGPRVIGDLANPEHHWQLGGDDLGADTAGTAPLTAGPGVGRVAGNATLPAPGGQTVTGPAEVAGLNGTGSLASDRPLIDTRESFTVTAWAKPTADGGVVLSQEGARSSAFVLWADPGDGRWHAALGRQDDDSWSYDQVTSYRDGRGGFTPSAWQQLTVAYDARTGLLSLQVDNQVAATGRHAAGDSFQATGAFQLGQYRYQGAPNARFKGELSDVALLHRAAAVPAQSGTMYKLALDGSTCLAAGGGVYQDGASLQAEPCGQSAGQRLSSHRADGTVRWGLSLCVDAYGNGTANGTATTFWSCNGGANQIWLPQADGSLVNPRSGRCLDLPNGNTATGTRFVLWDCNGGANQRFGFDPDPKTLV